MKKYTFSKIIDFIFKTTITFFICFVWIRFYIKALYTSLILSVIITALIIWFFTIIKNKKFETQKVTKQQNDNIQMYINEFLFSSEQENLQFFLKLALVKHSATIKDDFVVINDNGYKIAIYPYYKSRNLNIDEATNIYVNAKKIKPQKLIITCKKLNQEVLNFARQLKQAKLIVLDDKQTYFKLLKAYGQFPEVKNKLIQEDKITFRQMLYVMFNKKKAKAYLFSGTILLLGSFIVIYNLYYIIFSSILYLMALFSYFNVPFNKKIEQNILEKEDITQKPVEEGNNN